MSSSGANNSGSGSVSVIGSAKGRKNTAGSRSDPAWSHAYAVDGDSKKLRCKYCAKVLSGRAYRLKHHLARTQKDVVHCTQVPNDVKRQMLDIVSKLQKNLLMKSQRYEETEGSNDVDELVEVGEKRKGKGIENPLHLFKRKSNQATISSMMKKNLREDACRDISRFFYNNALPFYPVKSEEFHQMCESIARHGPGFKPPSYHEVSVTLLKQQVNLTQDSIEEHKTEWRKVGCSIMTDGWTDKRRRSLCNFLVNSPKGTIFLKSTDTSIISKTSEEVLKMMDEVLEQVGEDNVIQIVTDNARNYQKAGEDLMKKRTKLFWAPCAAHCLDLMLEDFGNKLKVHKETIAQAKRIANAIYKSTYLIAVLQTFTKGKDLIRPAPTRFATSYLTLGSIHDNKGAVMRMFTSKEWKSRKLAKTIIGKSIEEVVLDGRFWKNIVVCLKGAYPLIKVLRLVDSDEKPAMGFIYEEMACAKMKIKEAFKDDEKWYMPLWNIIDERWNKQLHRDLHVAGYYLNPKFHYSLNFRKDVEIKRGLYNCLQRMVPDEVTNSKIDLQLEDFKHARGFFGSKLAKNAINTKHPADWWDSYGDECQELKDFAIRILSLMCSSSGCEHNWSAFERVHTKKRNRLKQKTMNDLVYVMTNSKLSKVKQTRKNFEFSVEDLSSDDEWLVGSNESDENVPSDDDDDIQVGGANNPGGSSNYGGGALLEDFPFSDDALNLNDEEVDPVSGENPYDVSTDGVDDNEVIFSDANLQDLL